MWLETADLTLKGIVVISNASVNNCSTLSLCNNSNDFSAIKIDISTKKKKKKEESKTTYAIGYMQNNSGTLRPTDGISC